MVDFKLYIFSVFVIGLNVFVRNTGAGTVYKTIITEGTGPQPRNNQDVVVHYVGTLMNGQQFDSSRDRNEPFKFTLGAGEVIRGWDAVVGSMKVGERASVEIAPEDAYGLEGMPPIIPSNATLVFDIQLLRIETPAPSVNLNTMVGTQTGQQFTGQTPFTSLGTQGFQPGSMSAGPAQQGLSLPVGFGSSGSQGMAPQTVPQTQPWQMSQGVGQGQGQPVQPPAWQATPGMGTIQNTQPAWQPPPSFGSSLPAPPPPPPQQPWQTFSAIGQGSPSGFTAPMDTSMASQRPFQQPQGMSNIFTPPIPSSMDFQGGSQPSFRPPPTQSEPTGLQFLGSRSGMPSFPAPPRSPGSFQDMSGRGSFQDTRMRDQRLEVQTRQLGRDRMQGLDTGGRFPSFGGSRRDFTSGMAMGGMGMTRGAQRGASAGRSRDIRIPIGFPGMPTAVPTFVPGMVPGFPGMPMMPFMRPGIGAFPTRRTMRRRMF